MDVPLHSTNRCPIIMALKKLIDAAAFANLPEATQALYVKVGDGYKLDLEGDDGPTQADIDALKTAKDHEKTARQTAERELKELKAKGEGNGQEAETLKTEISALTERLNSRDGALKKSALEAAAGNITSKSKFPNVMKPHVLCRLQADLDESGNAIVSILGADGKPSKMTFDELTEEFKKNKEFEGLMLAPTSSGAGGGQYPADGSTKQLKDMSEKERVAFSQTDPDGFKAAIKAATPSV